MKTQISSYQQQALDFLKLTGATIQIEFKKYGKHFEDDEHERAIYSVTIKRGNRSYTFDFGQSYACSYPYNVAEHLRNKVWNENVTGGKWGVTEKEFNQLRYRTESKDIVKNDKYCAPNEYDILACLRKYDCGTFENFCADFGYNEDSRKAEKIYDAVCEEYKNLCALFSDEEMQLMSEIQ